MNSTVAIVGTASKGISFLSGDAEYVRKRALKRQRNRANRGGIVDGILDGSESVISGITSGMSGLVTKPFEEVRASCVVWYRLDPISRVGVTKVANKKYKRGECSL